MRSGSALAKIGIGVLVMTGWLCNGAARAGDVEFRMVVHDRLDTTVDKLELSEPDDVTNIYGAEGNSKNHASSTRRVVCWARNITLDGKPLFEKYVRDKLYDRRPRAKQNLRPGKHTLQPGGHVFEVRKDGSLSTESNELVIKDRLVLIKAYPLRFVAYQAAPDDPQLPEWGRQTSLPTFTLGDGKAVAAVMKAQKAAAEARKGSGPKTKPKKKGRKGKAGSAPKADINDVQLLPVAEEFSTLTVYVPANMTELGYGIYPLGYNLRLSAKGISDVKINGGDGSVLKTKGFELRIPVWSIHVTGEPGTACAISGSGSFRSDHDRPVDERSFLYPRMGGFGLLVDQAQPALPIAYDFAAWPFKTVHVDRSTPGGKKQRSLCVEIADRVVEPRSLLKARVRGVDASKTEKAFWLIPGKSATASARLQALEGDEWQDLAVKVGEGNVVAVRLPDSPNGIYRMRLSLTPKAGGRPLHCERYIAVARKTPVAIGLFSRKGRTAFVRGESFMMGIGMVVHEGAIKSGTPVEAYVTDANGKRMPLLKTTVRKDVAARDSIFFELTEKQTLALAPGVYRMHARVGTTDAPPFKFDLVESAPRSRFSANLNGKYCDLGKVYEGLLGLANPVEEADALVEDIVSAGHNVFTAFSHKISRRFVSAPHDIEILARREPRLGPWESYYQPNGRDAFLNAAVKQNLRIHSAVFTQVDDMLPRGRKTRAICYRYAGLETLSMRHSPAFKGQCFYDEFYDIAWPTELGTTSMLKLQQQDFREDHGMSSGDCMSALDRWLKRPPGQRKVKELGKFLLWPRFKDNEWNLFSKEMAQATKTVKPDARNYVQHRMWGGNGSNIGLNGTAPEVFESLEIAMNVGYKDGGRGDRPVWGPMGADIMRVRENIEVWPQIAGYNIPGRLAHCRLRNAFLTLSQKVEGITFFNQGFSRENQSQDDAREGHRNITKQLLEPYGDMFLDLKRGYSKVAIFYSRQADLLGGKKANRIACACEGLWVACLRAGFPADFIYEHQLLAGEGKRYDVIFAPGFTLEDEVAANVLKALRSLANAGKIIAVEQGSKLPLENIVRLPSDLDEYDDKQGGAFPKYTDFETEMVVDQSEETTKLVGAFLKKHILPAAEHDMLFGPDWLKAGECEYMVLSNWRFTGFSGLHKTLYQAPDRPTVRFPKRPPVCYDILENRQVPVETEGDWMKLRADFRNYPGKIYAFLPEAIAGVRIQVPETAKGASTLTYRIAIVGAKGEPINGAFPIEVTVADGADRTLAKMYRAASPVFKAAYAVPVNLASGKLTFKVRELASGRAAQATVAVGEGKIAPASTDDRPLWVFDAHLVKRFLKDDRPAVIAVGSKDDWVYPLAEELANVLRKRNRKVTIRNVSEVSRRPISIWFDGVWLRSPLSDGTRLWRGNAVYPALHVDSPVIALGNAYNNRLINEMIQRGGFAQPISPNVPGHGRAMLGCVERGFSNQFDTLALLANDTEGLKKAIDFIAASKPLSETLVTCPKISEPSPDSQPRLKPVTGTAEKTDSFRSRLALEDFVQTIDEDPATGRVLAGTSGYTTNLFCLDKQGKLLWKTFLPEHNVYFARWYDDGKRIVAASGHGAYIFLLDGKTGKVLRKFSGTLWPTYHGDEGPVSTQLHIVINPPLRQILIKGLTGLLAVDYDGNRMWYFERADAIAQYPKEAVQTAAASFPASVKLGASVLQPGGARVCLTESRYSGTTIVMLKKVPVFRFEPNVLDARTGKVIATLADPIAESAGGPGDWSVFWPEKTDLPLVTRQSKIIAWTKENKLGAISLNRGARLPDGTSLVREIQSAARVNANGEPIWTIEGPRVWITGLDRLDQKKETLYRCDRDGLVRAVDVNTGKTRWEYALPFNAKLKSVAGGLVAGTGNGLIARMDDSGKLLWQTKLRDLHSQVDGDYANYIQGALQRELDLTESYFSPNSDRPGDYDKILRLGLEQVRDGGFEGEGAWKMGNASPSFATPGLKSKRALQLTPGKLVTQKLERKIIPQATYLLELHYKPESFETQLVAGASLEGKKTTYTLSQFKGRAGEWNFARLAIKSMAYTKTLTVGLEAVGGEVLVDAVSLRPIRFPSANLLADSELHNIEPTFVKDIRVKYRRIPLKLKKKLLQRNHVAVVRPGVTTGKIFFSQEQAFLHNGRLDDIGPQWQYMPRAILFSAALMRPSYISHIVLYMNNAMPDVTYNHICIIAGDLTEELPVPKTVALVKGNKRRFVVVHFPKPIHTDVIKIIPGKHPGRQQCLTEVELYGPLDGQTVTPKPCPDPLAVPMLMANPTRVPAKLPADVLGNYSAVKTPRIHVSPAFHSGSTYMDKIFSFGNASGSILSIRDQRVQKKPGKEDKKPAKGKRKPKRRHKRQQPIGYGPKWPMATLTPTSTPARYARRLFVGSADFKMHAVADNGAYLWSFKTGGRVYSSPAPVGDDLYFGSDDGMLYKVDLHSGTLVWETSTGGKVRGSPAVSDGLVYVAGGSGSLFAVRTGEGKIAWQAKIAPHTRATPAVHKGRVYIGDEKGVVRCLDAGTGSVMWEKQVGGYHSSCPVVTPAGVFFCSEQGDAAWLSHDGAVAWKGRIGARLAGQPMATQTQLLLPTSAGLKVLRQRDGKPDDRFKAPEGKGRICSVIAYDRTLFMQQAAVSEDRRDPNHVYLSYHGVPVVWEPAAKKQ